MKTLFYDTHQFEREVFDVANSTRKHAISYVETRLLKDTAALASGFDAVCSFANDKVDRAAINILKAGGVKLIALRSAGFNHVDLTAAKEAGIRVVRVPAYSPYSVAEHAVALILSLNRKTPRAYQRVREGNFSLEGLVGFDLHGKTVGVVGAGRIGSAFARIMAGFGCKVLAFDPKPSAELSQQCGLQYVSFSDLLQSSDILSLHLPLTPQTRHLINDEAFGQMKKGAMLINTGRGGLVDTSALIRALKRKDLGFAGLDVYEEEEGVFFHDLSDTVLEDDQLARLLTFPNVLITSHQGFLTREALEGIAATTLKNIDDFERGLPLVNEVK